MNSLAAQKCLNHEGREAVCRCPECRSYFCRECVVPFEQRMLCAACLARSIAAAPQSQTKFGFGGLLLAAAGFMIVWLLFYFAGWAVLQLRERTPDVESSRNVWVISV
jgi:hypothetical protein